VAPVALGTGHSPDRPLAAPGAAPPTRITVPRLVRDGRAMARFAISTERRGLVDAGGYEAVISDPLAGVRRYRPAGLLDASCSAHRGTRIGAAEARRTDARVPSRSRRGDHRELDASTLRTRDDLRRFTGVRLRASASSCSRWRRPGRTDASPHGAARVATVRLCLTSWIGLSRSPRAYCPPRGRVVPESPTARSSCQQSRTVAYSTAPWWRCGPVRPVSAIANHELATRAVVRHEPAKMSRVRRVEASSSR